MELQGRTLSANMHGDDVAALHDELRRLGLEVETDEVTQRLFGESTELAVRDFQRHRDVPVTGTVDLITARALTTALLENVQVPRRFTVSGRVLYRGGQSAASELVQAFDRDMRSSQLLGEAITNERGEFRVVYSSGQFRRAEKRSADLVVRAPSRGSRTPRGESTVLFNAPVSATIDLVLSVDQAEQVSEYESYLASAAPVMEGMPWASLASADLDFLASETGIERERLDLLKTAARHRRRSGIPAEAFYGWGRRRLSLVLEALANQPDQVLRSELITAVADHIVPGWLRDRTDEIIGQLNALRLRLGLVVSRSLSGTLRVEGPAGQPVPGFTIHVQDLDAPGVPADLGYVVTDRNGSFRLTFLAPASNTTPRRLRLRVGNGRSGSLVEHDVVVPVEGARPIEVLLPVAHAPGGPSPRLDEVASRLSIDVPPPLRSFLTQRGIATLSDIRRAGGLAGLEGFPAGADDAIRALDTHANLELLSRDLDEAQALVRHRFDDVSRIARTPRTRFVRALRGDVGDFRAAQMYVAARAQNDLVVTVASGLRTDAENGYPMSKKGSLGDIDTMPQPGQVGARPFACSCDDCQAATSPLAYLADLLDYAVEYLKNGDSDISLAWLTSTFHQPFAELPTACAEMDKKVRQVRLCVEVLRRYHAAHNLSVDTDKERSYAATTYQQLLNQIGVTYDDIRLAKGAEPEARAALADRLGIELGEQTPDALDRLGLDLTAPPGDPAGASERNLEALFGLVDTTRNPFSQGVTLGDDANQLKRWTFRSLEWKRHTDGDGVIYLSLREQTAAGHVRVEMYRDAARTDLVAAGTRATHVGPVSLSPQGSSGLHADVEISYTADTDSVAIVAVPHVLAWRLAYLRTQWLAQDWPLDPYTEGAEGELPVLDPDLVGPDDLRRPESGQPSYDVWRNRRLWVDARLAALAAIVVDQGEGPVPDVPGLLDAMVQPVTYAPMAGAPVSIAAWSGGTQPDDLEGLHTQLVKGPDSEAAAKTIASDLHLTPESFTRLMELRTKSALASSSPSAPPVSDDEWREVLSILAQANKRALYPAWMAEEDQLGIEPGPKLFWSALREPSVGIWPPVRATGEPWIDPESIGPKDLPDITVGAQAREIWQARVVALAAVRSDLEAAQQAGFLAVIEHALGDPQPGDDLPPPVQDLDALYDAALSIDPAVSSAAHSAIQTHLFMSVDDFVRLVEVKTKADAADPALHPSADDWADALSILVSASKRKRLYPLWLAHESQTGLEQEYWRARKALLPEWRAELSARALWQLALAARSQPALIDPDRMMWAELRNTIDAAPARAIWQARSSWLAARLAELAGQAETLAGLAAAVGSALGVPPSALEDTEEEEQSGTDIAPRLAQLSVTRKEFLRLLRVQALLANASPVLADEWADVRAILVQVLKRREYADWQRQERAGSISLTPDFFALPVPDADEPELPAWRASSRERREFLETLRSRIDQQASAAQALADSVATVEGATLPSLRQALLGSLNKGGATVAAKATWVTKALLIDGEMGGCARTTRISQAIETIQELVRSAQANLLRDTHPDLTVADDDFYARWLWLGSYATWRAAILVFLYPENILHPNFRPVSEKTPMTRRLEQELRSDMNVTPESACGHARSYATYFRDVCHLEVKATCTAETRLVQADCGSPEAEDVGTRDLFYMFGRSSESGTLYYSTYDDTNESGYAESFWFPIEELAKVRMTEVIAAVPYHPNDVDRHIYLFFKRNTPNVVSFVKYDLNTRSWSDEVIDLDLPTKGASTHQVLVVQRTWVEEPPKLVIHRSSDLKNAYPYTWVRSVSADGTAWEGEEAPAEGEEGGDSSDEAAVDVWENYQTKPAFTKDPLIAAVEMGVDHTGQTGTFTELFLLHGTSITKVDVDDDLETSTQNLPDQVTAIQGAWIGAMGTSTEWLGNWLAIFVKSSPPVLVLNDMSGEMAPDVFVFLQDLSAVVPHHGPTFTAEKQCHRVYELTSSGPPVQYRISHSQFLTGVTEISRGLVKPQVSDGDPGSFTFTISEKLSVSQLQTKRATIAEAFATNLVDMPNTAANITYLEEAYNYIPMLLALKLSRMGFYDTALAWYRTVYDYSGPELDERKIYYGLVAEEDISLAHAYDRDEAWLLDPLNPHRVAASRRNANTRFTLLSIIQCFLEFADARFTFDTAESVAHARTLYLAAIDLLDSQHLKQSASVCDEIIGELEVEIGSSSGDWWTAPVTSTLQTLAGNAALFEQAAQAVSQAFASSGSQVERYDRAIQVIDDARVGLPASPRFGEWMADAGSGAGATTRALFAHPVVADMAVQASEFSARRFMRAMSSATGMTSAELANAELPWLAGIVDANTKYKPGTPNDLFHVPGLPAAPKVFDFCVPKNPLLQALRSRAEANLAKIRSCRNFAGMRRELEPYAAPTDTVSGLPTIGAGDQLVLPGLPRLAPTQYRYQTLIERAKQLVALAQQAESAFLTAIEKAEAEQYNVLKARQDAEIARAGTRLQALRVKQARDEIGLAVLQRERAEIERDTYENWLQQGMTQLEEATIMMLGEAIAAAAASLDAAGALQATGQLFTQLAAFERRAQEWELRRALAEQDVLIGAQQVRIAQAHFDVVDQERAIAEQQSEHAQEGLDFIHNKFTNAELYEWMSDVLAGVYRFFLRQATSMAQLAATQLAFERQTVPPPYIQADYWEQPDAPAEGLGERVDRRGLTGSMRLLRDIVQLDQYAFETDRRKLQLTKIISLARFAPVEFQRFRETGVFLFSTPMEIFDRDFPGHYLRLIKRIRTSVIALVPPNEGIRATLSSTGLSRVVIEANSTFQTVPIKTLPQSVALSSAIDATGLFGVELGAISPEMLLPFEGMGVDASLELRMAKSANQIEYPTIADVLVSIDYTALDSPLYREQVLRQLDSRFRADRALLFRHELADQWFDLHNPDQSATPMTVQFRTTRADFAPNVDDLRISHLMLYFSPAEGAIVDWPSVTLSFTEDGAAGGVGGTATPVDGLVSTRRGMGASWMSMLGKKPVGTWEMSLPNTGSVRQLFKQERAADMLMVIHYTGYTPPWPS